MPLKMETSFSVRTDGTHVCRLENKQMRWCVVGAGKTNGKPIIMLALHCGLNYNVATK